MRISDWSSDVCSSDLQGGGHDAADEQQVAPQDHPQHPEVDLEPAGFGRVVIRPAIEHRRPRHRGAVRVHQKTLTTLTSEIPENIEERRHDVAAVDARWREIGRAHVWNPVTNAHIGCRILLETKK